MSNQHHRVLIIDTHKADRELLSLSLRSLLEEPEIGCATSAIELAERLGGGRIDAVVADCGIEWTPVLDLVNSIRRSNPACVCCLFSRAEDQLDDAACVGHGIDANLAKESEHYLGLPRLIAEAIERASGVAGQERWRRAALLPDALPVPAFVLSGSGVIQTTTPGFEQALGLPRYRFVGRDFANLITVAADQNLWRKALDHADSEAGASRDLQLALKTAADAALPLRVVLRAVGDAGAPVFWIGVLLEGSRASVAPIDASRRGDDAAQLPIAQMLSHDLQQPLQNVVRHARWLLEHDRESLSGEAVNTATHILNSATRMQDMVDGALMLSRIDASSAGKSIVDLNVVVQDALENLRLPIEQAHAMVEVAELPSVWGQHAQLVQLFQNLIGNAVKFRGDRVPRIRLSAARRGNHHQIRIEDNGIGIRREDVARIFELFTRLHDLNEYAGIGIGLAICKRIAEGHGGRIWVESERGRGSVFFVEFPASIADFNGANAKVGRSTE